MRHAQRESLIRISRQPWTVEVGRIPLIERSCARLMSVADGDEGRGKDDALNAGVACGAENAESTLTRGDDEFILVLGSFSRKR